MSDDLTDLRVAVRLDTPAFQREVAAMRSGLEGSLATSADRAGQTIEATLLRAVRTGKLGFEDLRKTALNVLADIASTALKQGIGAVVGSGGIGKLLGGLIGASHGFPGRATGGPVSPQRPYWVGERGPELFVPTASGRVEAAGSSGGARTVNVAIRVQADAATAPAALAKSSRQVARAVRAALADES